MITIKQLVSLSTYGIEPIETVRLIADSLEVRKMLISKYSDINKEPIYNMQSAEMYISVKYIFMDDDICNLTVLNFGIDGDNSIYINV